MHTVTYWACTSPGSAAWWPLPEYRCIPLAPAAGDEAGRSSQPSVPRNRLLPRSQPVCHHMAKRLRPFEADKTAIPWDTWKYDWQESGLPSAVKLAFCFTTPELPQRKYTKQAMKQPFKGRNPSGFDMEKRNSARLLSYALNRHHTAYTRCGAIHSFNTLNRDSSLQQPSAENLLVSPFLHWRGRPSDKSNMLKLFKQQLDIAEPHLSLPCITSWLKY